MYRNLDPVRVVETADTLQRRVAARFPESGLSRVAAELAAVSKDAAAHARWLGRPNWTLRVLAGFAIALLLLIVGATGYAGITALHTRLEPGSLADFLQGLDAAINETVLLGVAIVFLIRMETRIKRKRVQKAIHVLRSIAHIIDMHQLTKDPHRTLQPSPTVASVKKPPLTALELERYLDYCAELLAVCSKVAAIYVQHFEDEVALEAVNDLENLTTSLSRNIWQKIVILGRDLKGLPGAEVL
ncbi:MAG: hypothetical protein QM790_12865 [Nibricoccus sp.]